MNCVDTNSHSAIASPPVKPGEFWLEVIVVPVSVDGRAKSFYEGLGWRLDAEVAVEDGYLRGQIAAGPQAHGHGTTNIGLMAHTGHQMCPGMKKKGSPKWSS